MNQPTRIVIEGRDGELRISPPIWPKVALDIQPGDLTKIAPRGTGLYGLQGHNLQDPFDAPIHEPTGGVIYFPEAVTEEGFRSLLALLEIKDKPDFAVFSAESSNPQADRYLHQLRVVSRFALRFLFQALTADEYDSFPDQCMGLHEALWFFIEQQRETWGTDMGDPRLAGKFGGDGNFTQEQLAFGLLVENEYHGVYRIWSRAWLVTK